MVNRINTNTHVISLNFQPNGFFPNSKLPVLVYRQGLFLPNQKNKAAEIIHKVFAHNGWSNSWTNGIYDFHHYHSNTHECIGVAMGTASVILGGPNGKRIILTAGDVIILPAGTAHKRTICSTDFLCVGAYPQGKDYNINTGTSNELEKALAIIDMLPNPINDPVFGKHGFLKSFWYH